MKRYLRIILFFGVSWFVLQSVIISVIGWNDDNCECEVGVILGNKVNEDGTLSKRLEKRLERGLLLFQTNKIKTILVSGGLGKEGYYEGNQMKAYLIEKGVPTNSIMVDNKGNNTYATAVNVREMITENQSIYVISQYFHIVRTKMIFKKMGFNKVCTASPNYIEIRDIYALIREFAGYYKYWLYY